MTKLMDDHIIEYFHRYKRQQAVKVEVSLTTAAAPSGMLRPNGNLVIGHSDKRSIVPYPIRNQCASFLPKRFQFHIGKLLLVLSGTIGQVILDPSCLALNEPTDFFHSHSFRSANNYIAFRLNLYRDGLAVTADNAILYRESNVT